MSDSIEPELRARASDQCELCGSSSALAVHVVGPGSDADADHCVLLCDACRAQHTGTPLDAKHWYCLKEAIWSGVPAVQVLSYRLLTQLGGEAWADDLLGQAYLDDSVLAWANEGQEGGGSVDDAPALDSNGTPLADGDSVTLIKDLDVKGTNFVAKRGTMVKNIRLIPGDPNNIEGRVNKVGLVLKTCFLKKTS